MISLRRALVGIGVAGLATGLLTADLILTSDHVDLRGVYAVLTVLIGWSFIGTGLFAWWRRPDNRVGALMTAIGFAWFVSSFPAADSSWIFLVGVLLNNLAIVLLVLLLLVFPTGRLRTRGERVIALGAWIAGLVLQVPPFLFAATPDDKQCEGCPTNPILVDDNEALANLLFNVQAAIAVPLLIALIVVLVRRWRNALPAERTALRPMFWAGGMTMVLLIVQLAALVAQLPRGVPQTIYLVAVVGFLAVPYAFLIGLLQTRVSRGDAVSALVARLGNSPVGEQGLREALAQALGDPSLSIAYWVPESDGYVDARGYPVELPKRGSGRAASPVARDGRPVAAIVHSAALPAEPELIRTVGAAAALALENQRLDAELRARLEELRASRARLVESSDAERRRLERNLHDGAQQSLQAVSLDLRLARSKVEQDPAGAAELMDKAIAELSVATKELRELARGIHPAVLTDRGLGPALEALAGRATVPVEVVASPSERLPEPVESAAYFVVAEALTNVGRYAGASHAEVLVTRSNGRVVVEVRDDGVGGADPSQGSGLRGLADRVAALDGRLEVRSPAGAGTVLRADIPLA